ncbi:purine nucleoside permease [Silvibacterium acidisoli]|uniref:purine nucleoside permease n=1 Tax=Acidobacteriaceae bacterium ZG23-2 TaxID=2883246 RepID=UPI00406CE692
MRIRCGVLSLAFVLFTRTLCAAGPAPIPIKVVVVAMFEPGEDSGDVPGEFQYWVEREHLNRVMPLPAGYHPLRMNDQGVLGILTGIATAHAAASIMALGLDPRFDLSHAYWIVAGIAGGDPADVSLGSAVWVRNVVEGDIAHEIDAREIPADWPTGYVPLGKYAPYEKPMETSPGMVYTLNPHLTDWALALTRSTPLADTPTLQERRSHFPQQAAQRPPFITSGDEVSAGTFWHGAKMDEWANRWDSYYTGGKGNFVVTGMEDSGTLQSLTFLANAKRIDLDRVLVLRTVSNYDQQPAGLTAAESLAAQKISKYGAYLPSLEAAYAVGHPVVDELVAHWDRYRDRLP